MTVSLTLGALKKFRRTPWRFQQTVERPDASDSESFVSTIVAANGELQKGTLTIDEVVFNGSSLFTVAEVLYAEGRR
jgi:hypothetical protein